MTAFVVAMAVIVASGVASWLRFRDALFPPVIHAATWGLVLIAQWLAGDLSISLPPTLYAIIAAGVATFAAGAWITTHAHQPDFSAAGWRSTQPRAHVTWPPRRWIGSGLLVISVAGIPLFLLRAMQLSVLGPTENFFANVRLAVSGDILTGLEPVGSFGLVEYLVPLSLIAAGYEFFLAPPGGARLRYWIAVLAAFAYAILATGRTYAIFVILLVSGLELITRRVSAVRGAATVGALGLFAFVGLAVLLGRIAGTGIIAAGEMLLSYGVSGTAAFGLYIQQDHALAWGANLLRTPFSIFAALGFDLPVVPLIKEYSWVPEPTNVYTVFLPWFDDFGWAGVTVAPFALGMLHGLVYRRATAREATPFWMLLYALALYPLLMQGFQEQYVSLLSLWVQLVTLAGIGFLFTGSRLRVPRPARAELA